MPRSEHKRVVYTGPQIQPGVQYSCEGCEEPWPCRAQLKLDLASEGQMRERLAMDVLSLTKRAEDAERELVVANGRLMESERAILEKDDRIFLETAASRHVYAQTRKAIGTYRPETWRYGWSDMWEVIEEMVTRLTQEKANGKE